MHKRLHASLSLFVSINIVATSLLTPMVASAFQATPPPPARAPSLLPSRAPAQAGGTVSPMPYSRGKLIAVMPSPKFALDRTLYVLTARELFRSTDAGGSWSVLSAWPDGSETMPGFLQGNVADAGNNLLALLIVTSDGQLWQLDPTTLDWQPYDRKIDAGTLHRGPLDAESALGVLYGAGNVQTASLGENQRSFVQIDQDGGVQTVDVNLATPLQQGGADRFLLMTSSAPTADPSTWICDSCQPMIGGALFSETTYGWQLDFHTPAIATLGQMGAVPPGQWHQIGPDTYAVLFHSNSGSEGNFYDTTVLLAPIDGQFQEVFRAVNLETNGGSSECSADRDGCSEVRRSLTFTPGENPAYYDIQVRAHGTRLVDGTLATVDETSTFVFADGLYQPAATPTENAHNLDVDITYAGDFYTDVFDYARNAPNIRHLALVLPPSEAVRAEEALRVFQFIQFPEDPSLGLKLTEAGGHYAWVLDYVHVAPGGRYSADLPAGQYQVATAILAAPISREEAAVTEDVILYPGITGGGLSSTAYTAVDVTPDQPQNLSFVLTDADGWACPWLYVHDGSQYVRVTEILRNVRGKSQERVETTTLSGLPVVDGTLRVRIQEEKAETSYIDQLTLTIDGVELLPDGGASATLAARDGKYQVLHQGDAIELTFVLPSALAARNRVDGTLTAAGYYTPAQ